MTNLLVAEGNGEPNIDLLLQLSVASPYAITVDFATTDIEAIGGVDYVSTNGTLTFNPGETNLALPLTILGETMVESDEMFQIVMTNITNGQLATSNVTITIGNDDFPPPPPQIMLLTELDPTNGLLTITLTNLLGLALSETNVAMECATNLDLPGWVFLTNQFVSTNGTLRIENLDTRDLPAQYFRARQIP